MPSVRCDALECVSNNGRTCTQHYIRMKTKMENGRTMWQCNRYEPSKEFVHMLSLLGNNPKLSSEKEDADVEAD